jgi:hypothetical protein
LAISSTLNMMAISSSETSMELRGGTAQ